MTLIDYTPFLLPAAALAVILAVMLRRRKPAAKPPEQARQRPPDPAPAPSTPIADWRAFLDRDPARIDIFDPIVESFAARDDPDLLPAMFDEIEQRPDHGRIRALRLELLGWLTEFQPGYPPADQTLRWTMDGLASEDREERHSALAALANISEHHRFDPDADQAAMLRDRLIALAFTEEAEDQGRAADIADALRQITGLAHCDAAPLDAALQRHIELAADPDAGGDPWHAAQRADDTGSALVPPLRFAAAALDHDPADPVLSAAALLALTRVTRQLRSRRQPVAEAEQITRTLLTRAPPPVLARLAAALEAEPDLTPDWSAHPGNLAALASARDRSDLPHDLHDRLSRLHDRLRARADGAQGN